MLENARDQRLAFQYIDGAGNLLIAWQYYQGPNSNIFAQKIDGNGAVWQAAGPSLERIGLGLLWAVVMVLYSLIFAFNALMLSEMSYEAWREMFSGGFMRFATFLFFLSLFYHAWVGVRDIFMDYIKPDGVRLALHPNDPPTTEALGGIPCLIHSWETYERAFEIADSPALGMEFCCGCWLEGGTEGFGDILAAIRHFVAEDRVLLVHFRNITSPLPVFEETFLNNGYMEMYKVMRAFVEAGYGNTMTLDHTPRFVEGYEAAGTGYAIGYMRSHCFSARWSGRRRS